MTGSADVDLPAGSGSVPAGRDVSATALVLGFASAMWFGWAQENPPDGWGAPLTLGSLLGLLLAVMAAVTTWQQRHRRSAMHDPRGRRTYHRVVGVEVAAIALGVVVLAAIGWSTYLAPWILFVVGVHFVPLGRLFHIRDLAVSGVLLALVAVGGASLGVLGAAQPSAVAGTGGGAVMVFVGARCLWASRRHPAPGARAV